MSMKAKRIFYIIYMFLTSLLLLITVEGLYFFNERQFKPEYRNFTDQYIKIEKNFIEQTLDEKIKANFIIRLNNLIIKNKGNLFYVASYGAGLGIVDYNSYYGNEIVEGKYFNLEDFIEDNKTIIAIEDSYFAGKYNNGEKEVVINGNPYIIKGIIKRESFVNLWYGDEPQYIFPYKSTKQVSGRYYINLENKNDYKEIIELFNDDVAMNGSYIYNIDYTKITKKDRINLFLKHGRGLRFFVIGILFSILNMGIYMYWNIMMDRKAMRIHFLLGVTKRQYFVKEVLRLFIGLLIGSLLAEYVYCYTGKLKLFYISSHARRIVENGYSFYLNFKGVTVILFIIYLLLYTALYFLTTRKWEVLWEEK